MKIQPWYSLEPNDLKVYHDNSDCKDGKRIDLSMRHSGTGDRPRCNECVRLDRLARELRGHKAFEELYHRTAE